jgi:uncharacterized protein YecE (DUF72 family)
MKIGCCGFPKGMKKYFTKFKVVEVQTTFYNLPDLSTVNKWKTLAPPDFEFCVKAWQGITHPASSPTYKRFKGELEKKENYGFFQRTEEVMEAWKGTERICSALDAKYVLFQCPSSFKPTNENIENMKGFFNEIKGNFRFVWEPRGKWEDSIISKICEEVELIHCVDPFARAPVTQKIAYFRLHGSPPGNKMYYYNYTRKDLQYLLDMCKGYDEVYCFFNNLNMYENALQFMEIIA